MTTQTPAQLLHRADAALTEIMHTFDALLRDDAAMTEDENAAILFSELWRAASNARQAIAAR